MAGRTACLASLLLLLLAAAVENAAHGAELNIAETVPMLSLTAVQDTRTPTAAATAASQALDQANSYVAQAAVPNTATASNTPVDYSLCSAQPPGTGDQQHACGGSVAPVPVHIAAPFAATSEATDTGDRSTETAELLELAGVTDDAVQQLTSRSSATSSSDWKGGGLSQLRKLLGTQRSSSSSNSGSSSSAREKSMHRKLMLYYGLKATHGFLLTYTLSFKPSSSSLLLSTPADAAHDFKLAVEVAVGHLIPAPGPKVMPPVVTSMYPGNPFDMVLGMYLQTDAAMKAAASGTGAPPDELMATVDAAMTGVTALKMVLGDVSITTSLFDKYGLVDVAVHPSQKNAANIAACVAFVVKSRRTIGDGGLSGGANALLFFVPVVVGLAVGLRLLCLVRARRCAAAAAAIAGSTAVPASSAWPVKQGQPAAEPAVGVPFNGRFSSVGQRASSPLSVVSPFAACQHGSAYAAPAVGGAVTAGHSVQYGSGHQLAGSAAYPAVHSPGHMGHTL